MPKLDCYSPTGSKLTPIAVSPKIFGAKINPVLMAQAVRVYLANQRQASAKAKRRGEVLVSHAKVWRQKGTGRARHGYRNAPIFVGGGRAHGPTGTKNYYLKFPQKMKRLSLFSALTQKLKDKQILAVSGLEKLAPKTKNFHQVFGKLFTVPEKLVLLVDKTSPAVKRGTANLAYLRVMPAANLTTYRVLQAKNLIFTKEAVKALEKIYVN